MTDAGSKFEFRKLKVPELKHILKGKRIPTLKKNRRVGTATEPATMPLPLGP